MNKYFMNRVKVIKMKNNDDIIASLVLCPNDFDGTVFQGSTIVDRFTNQECIAVAYPVRLVSQYVTTTKQTTSYYIKWISQSNNSLYLIPAELIGNITDLNKEAMAGYRSFFGTLAKQAQEEKKPANEEKIIKVLSPEHPETH